MHDLNFIWAIPFFCVLLSIAICPLFLGKIWEEHSRRILFFPAFAILVSIGLNFSSHVLIQEIVNVILSHYLPLMAILLSLFVVTGGVYVNVDYKATPFLNCMFLLTGTLLAGWIGTTGASMLLIRPLINVNKNRNQNIHVIVFFIFLVSNIGGVLTPLGDPPLFVGFLEGVDFFWTFKNLYLILIPTCVVLITVFYCLDKYLMRVYEKKDDLQKYSNRILLIGWGNIFLVFIIITLTIVSGVIDLGQVTVAGVDFKIVNFAKDILLFFIAFVSWKFTAKRIKDKNKFSLKPFIEVAEIFLTIFMTLIPVSEMLKAGDNGSFKYVFDWISVQGVLDPLRVFWACGVMSSILDNAPSYLMFFNLSGGNAAHLMLEGKNLLMAISISSVFMGAMTYIGNAPNLMVNSIAIQSGIKMPGFLRYVLYSCLILLPLYIVISVLLFG